MYKCILIFLVFFSCGVLANESKLQKELTSTLDSIRTNNNIPAMSVAVIAQGQVTYSQGFGTVGQNQPKLTDPQTSFRIASISKLFTAQAIMQLVDQNKVDLDSRIDRYLADLKGSDVTVRQLLTHTSGLIDTVKPQPFESKRTVHAYMSQIKPELLTKTGPYEFNYSDANYNVLGAIINVASGISFEEYINSYILKPARMSRSGYFSETGQYAPDAEPTYKGNLIGRSEQRPFDLSFNPSEGLISNVNDLSLWLLKTLERDELLLKKQTYRNMLEPQIKTSWGEIYMGLGWQVYESDNGKVARHPGGIRGYKSLVITYPERKNALILLTNSSNTPRWEIARAITKVMKDHGKW